MKKGFLHQWRNLWRGQSLLHILMNEGFILESIRGRVVDVGGGRQQTYLLSMQRVGEVEIEAVDASISGIDFEKDALPYSDGSVDTVLSCNVLEHIYNHQFLISEMKRILQPGGRLIGFVPFLFNYHPDPQDYFRYTGTALNRLLADAGFSDVTVRSIGGGPFLLNFNTLAPSLPRILRVFFFPFYRVLDYFFLMIRPSARARYPLGYIFSGQS